MLTQDSYSCLWVPMACVGSNTRNASDHTPGLSPLLLDQRPTDKEAKFTLSVEILYLASTTLIKISILCFYRRLASGALSKMFLYCVWGTILIIALFGIIFILVITFSYSPIEGFWRIFDIPWRLQNRMTSLDEGALIVSGTTLGAVHDIMVCALPIMLVWNLKMPRRQKIGLVFIFSAGVM